MTVTHMDQIPGELIEEWASYLEPSCVASFRQICAEASMQTIDSVLRPFFATWRTSLMGDDLAKLKSISMDKRLRNLVETITIRDDCEKLDPWASSEPPCAGLSYDVWPRDDAGIVIKSAVGIEDLTTMFREKLISPKTIKIRDYRIAPTNLRFSPEMEYARRLIKETSPTTTDPVPVAVLARDLIDGASLAITSLAIRNTDLPLSEDSPIHSAQIREKPETSVLTNPTIQETVIGLSSEYQGNETNLSMLRSAELLLGGKSTLYWLEQVFYKAPAMEILRLLLRSPWSPSIVQGRVVPKLTEFFLTHATTSAAEIIAMLASSKESLTNICFRQVTLSEGSTWQELLLFIANSYRALTSFSLVILREKTKGYLAVDFRQVKKEHIPEDCRPGLSLIERGPPHNKRVSRLSYDGPKAKDVLEILARHVQAGVSN